MTILLTNDDGIKAPGLWAAAEQLAEIADVWIAAPNDQYSASGRSYSHKAEGTIHPWDNKSSNNRIKAFSVDGSPAQCIHHAILEILPSLPDLVVSGINPGANASVDVTRSGTIGAALEGANYGIPALAVSLESHVEETFILENKLDYKAAAHFCRLFANAVMKGSFGKDVHVLKIEVPKNAVAETPWEVSRLSMKSLYMISKAERSDLRSPGRLEWYMEPNHSLFEEGTDVHTILVKKMVAVTPLSLDMTSRVDLGELGDGLRKAMG